MTTQATEPKETTLASRTGRGKRAPAKGSLISLPVLMHATLFGLLCTAIYFAGNVAKYFLDDQSMRTYEELSSRTIELKLIPAVLAALAVLHGIWQWARSRKRVFLLDFACYKPPDDLKVSYEGFITGLANAKLYTPESLDFQQRISQRNGLSEETYLSPGLKAVPPCVNMETSRQESAMVLAGAVQDALDRTGLSPRDIDILVVNCSLFCPTPSLSAMLVNRFKMREDILSFNLGGMGCSAGVIAIGLAQRLLKTEPEKYALVVSTENITQNCYTGADKSMLIPNTLFRVGGAAVILTNRVAERRRAKYELQHVVRVHMGHIDMAYECVFQREDEKSNVGVELNKDLVKVASKALEKNLTKLGPLVLPISEQLQFAANLLQRKVLGKRMAPYVPNFAKAFDHFCLHAGGRAVIEGLGGQLGLERRAVEPSFNSLYWYGNTSSGSLWYALSYIESCQRVKKGETVWQVGFGSGFKCNSVVWKAIRNIHDTEHAEWAHMSNPSNIDRCWNYIQENASYKSKYSSKYGQEPPAKVVPSEHTNGQAHTNGHAFTNGHTGSAGQPEKKIMIHANTNGHAPGAMHMRTRGHGATIGGPESIPFKPVVH